MQPFDVDGRTVVSAIEDIDWTKSADGRTVVEQLLTFTLTNRNGWADVLIVVREWGDGEWRTDLRYHLTRWRRFAGAWRLHDRMRMSQPTLDAIAAHADLARQTGEDMVRSKSQT
jgi:hypothetical protein